MNDLISRQEAIDLFPNDALEWDTYSGYIASHFARRMIEELPSAQPEIIRCKDCKFSMSGIDKYNERYILCQLHERSYGAIDDGFCSWAERKEE